MTGIGGPPSAQRLGVAALLLAAQDLLAARFGAVTVHGEISGFMRAASGHAYFALKDGDGAPALLRCVMFRRALVLAGFAPADGQRVQLRGRLSVYEARGELQMIVEAMQHDGAGALYEEFLRRRARLQAEGWFDPARKRPLPAVPQALGVVSSLAGAALHDVLQTLARRAPHVRVVVYPTLVQGPQAPAAIVDALLAAQHRAEVDALILCRGGGSLEDLWAFNDERVVRAVGNSVLPVICGVGHETDVTLAELAADLRAATPTAAAELAAADRAALLESLRALAGRIAMRVRRRLESEGQSLDTLALRFGRPAQRLGSQRERLARLDSRLSRAVATATAQLRRTMDGRASRLGMAPRGAIAARRGQLEALAARLAAVDPAGVLRRGYAWVEDAHGRPVTSVGQLAAGMPIAAVWSDGRAQAEVRSIEPAPAPASGDA